MLCTSRPGINAIEDPLFNLSRVAIRASATASDIQRYCSYNIKKELLRWNILQFPRLALGMKRYTLLQKKAAGREKRRRQRAIQTLERVIHCSGSQNNVVEIPGRKVDDAL